MQSICHVTTFSRSHDPALSSSPAAFHPRAPTSRHLFVKLPWLSQLGHRRATTVPRRITADTPFCQRTSHTPARAAIVSCPRQWRKEPANFLFAGCFGILSRYHHSTVRTGMWQPDHDLGKVERPLLLCPRYLQLTTLPSKLSGAVHTGSRAQP